MTLRGSAKTAAGASVSGKLHDAPAPSLAQAIQNVADAYYEVEHATSRMEFFAKVLFWWDAREALREFLTGPS